MKKLLVLLGIAMAMGCTSRSVNPGFKIIGNIQGLNNHPAVLYRYIHEKWVPVDTVNAEKGAFMFLGRVESPEMFKIEISDTLPPISVFVENDEINLVAEIDSLHKYNIAGSETHEEYERFWGKQQVFSDRMDALEKELTIVHKKNNRKKKKEIEVRMKQVWQDELESIREYVFSHQSSVVSAYLAWSRLASHSDASQLNVIIENFDTSLNKSVYIELLNNYNNKLKQLEPGQPAIDFSMHTYEGEVLQLSSLYGKYLLVDFWASWCPPCREENPSMVSVFNKYKHKGFDILGVSFDKNRDKWITAIEDDQLTWNHVSDLSGWSNAAGKMYGIRSIPSNVLVDPNGTIIARNLRGDDLEKTLNEVLN
jgi:peroxiredoxin